MLVWARQSAGLALEDLAARLRVKPEKVAGNVQIDKASRRDFDFMYEGQAGVDPSGVLTLMWHSSNTGPGGWAWTGFTSDRIDELLDMGYVEMDSKKRCEYYTEVQQIVMENALAIPAFNRPFFWGMAKDVQGFALNPVPWFYYPYTLRFEE